MVPITPRIIVHGFPAIGVEHIYRNPRGEILRYMDTYHRDHYKVYNFCCEYGRGYEPSVFHGRVERYPFKDHNTPPLITMHAFANSVQAFLENDPLNVVNMHCKAGKGRAGLMCCVALVRTGFCQSAQEAMQHYDKTRVVNNKGLTVTSQRKYVVFYELLWRKFWGVRGDIGQVPADVEYEIPEQPVLCIYKAELYGITPNTLPYITIRVYKGSNREAELLNIIDSAEKEQTQFSLNTSIQGNFKVRVEYKSSGIFSNSIKKAFELWHNTLFIER